MEANRGQVDVESLVEVARDLAAMLSLEPASERDIRAKIDEILFERQTLACVREHILTEREGALRLLEHFLTMIPDFPLNLGTWPDEELLRRLREGMFGAR
jgi:hypothetical protein